MISLKNISYGYQSSQRVIDDLTLDFADGKVYGLLGKNGEGKSTLLYLIAGLLRPQVGEVLMDGQAPSNRDPQLLADFFIVPEEYDLPALSLREYVALLRPFYPRFSEELLAECLAAFGMCMDLTLSALSMGQKKKVYLCIALAANTRYLLLDEPTNGLDILSKSQFRKVVVTGMSEEKTVIISTHQIHDVERLLDHVVILNEGRVALDSPLLESADVAIDLEKLFVETVEKQ